MRRFSVLSVIVFIVSVTAIGLQKRSLVLGAKDKKPPSLTRYPEDKGPAFDIPLTKFCLVENTAIANTYGWIQEDNIVRNTGSQCLLIEMNSTDVEGWMVNGNIAGSVQFAMEIPMFTDSLILLFDGKWQRGLYLVNNYGGGDDKKDDGMKGKLKLYKKNNNVYISSALELLTQNPFTRQELKLDDDIIPVYDTIAYRQLEAQSEAKREKQRDDFAEALVSSIKTRDSLWDIAEKEQAKLPRQPFKGAFRFWISDVNKLGHKRTTYFFSEDSVIIKEGPYDFIYFSSNYSRDKVRHAAALPAGKIAGLNKIGETLKRDTLQSTYTSFCIIDGLILHFQFEWHDKEYGSTISNYYKQQIAQVVEYVNSIVPGKYKLWYDKDVLLKRQKECDTNRLLGD